jgi:tetratricopeptide (TPR) repeat protein
MLEYAEEDYIHIPFEAEPRVWFPRFLRSGMPWQYIGATREYLKVLPGATSKRADYPIVRDHADGSSRKVKFQRDIELLKEALARDSSRARDWFYLGESYIGIGAFKEAAAAFTNCAMTTRSGEEKYMALLRSGESFAEMGDWRSAITRFLLADKGRPARREALLKAYQLLNHLGHEREVRALLRRRSLVVPLPPSDLMGVLAGAYDHLMRDAWEHAHTHKIHAVRTQIKCV